MERGFPVKTFARTGVDEINNSLKLIIRNGKEIAALREKEAKKIVNVFVAAAFPRRMRLSKENRSVQGSFDFPEEREFGTIVEGNTEDRTAMKSFQHSLLGFFRTFTAQASGAEEARFTIDHGNNPAFTNSTANRVTFPVANPQPLDDLRRPISNQPIRMNGIIVGISRLNTLSFASEMRFPGETNQ